MWISSRVYVLLATFLNFRLVHPAPFGELNLFLNIPPGGAVSSWDIDVISEIPKIPILRICRSSLVRF